MELLTQSGQSENEPCEEKESRGEQELDIEEYDYNKRLWF